MTKPKATISLKATRIRQAFFRALGVFLETLTPAERTELINWLRLSAKGKAPWADDKPGKRG